MKSYTLSLLFILFLLPIDLFAAENSVKDLLSQTVVVDISALKTLPYVMDRVADKKIIYVGENHTQFSNHAVQLEIIKNLRERGKSIAIGMEMFQKPFQEGINKYIEGKNDEREFLKTTEYFARWGYDYRLYRPILQYAREEMIPVVALNIPGEIVNKVFRGGLASLTEQDRRLLPSDMDFSDGAYEERLKKIFQEHEHPHGSSFDFFYQAQIVWDETMAESIRQFLTAHPDHQMIVLAGVGHIAYGSGIPRRVRRINGYDDAIILNDEDLQSGIADYVLFPGDVPFVGSPRLAVLLTEEAGKVKVSGFPHGSASRTDGIKVGDILLSIDRTPIHSIDDLKIDLLYRQKGERVTIRILRKGWLFRSKEMDFEMTLR